MYNTQTLKTETVNNVTITLTLDTCMGYPFFKVISSAGTLWAGGDRRAAAEAFMAACTRASISSQDAGGAK